MDSVSKKTEANTKSNILEWIKFIVTLIIVYLVVANTVGFTRVSGHSMDPTLKDGSLLLVNKLSAHIGSPKHGDVVIIDNYGKGYELIKRVVGLPGDNVSIKDGTIYVNSQPVVEAYSLGKSDDMKEITVPKDKVFVMGDNRTPGESLDSRSPEVGPLPLSAIKGYAVVSVFPAYKIMKPLKV